MTHTHPFHYGIEDDAPVLDFHVRHYHEDIEAADHEARKAAHRMAHVEELIERARQWDSQIPDWVRVAVGMLVLELATALEQATKDRPEGAG